MKVYLRRMKTKTLCPEKKAKNHIVWSWLGSFIGIYILHSIESQYSVLLIGSFGASAVLVYGAPDSDFAQPRNLIGGHILSAILGVAIYKAFGNSLPFSSALAVSTSIALMHYTRTMHPPGGATALIAVIGGSRIADLGFFYVIYPVTTGAFVLLAIALFVNNFSRDSQRHYPKYWL